MKKSGVFLGLCLFALAAGAGFAQSNSVGVDVVPTAKGLIALDKDADTGFFGLGAFYEHALGGPVQRRPPCGHLHRHGG